MSHLEQSLKKTLEKAKYFTLRGCVGHGLRKGPILISETAINAISNWSGNCTDPNDVDNYKNPDAMFEALDLIYKVLEYEREDMPSSTEKET